MRSILVDRDSLSLAPLQVWQTGKFILPEGTFGGGSTGQRRKTTESDIVRGSYSTAIVEGQRTGNVSVHIFGNATDTLQDLVMEVITAFTQFRYTLAWQYNGLAGTWQCEAADYDLGQSGGIIDEGWLSANSQAINFSIPHNRLTGP